MRCRPLCVDPGAAAAACEARPSTKLAGLLEELRACGKATTNALAIGTDLTPRQVWGLLKAPRQHGQVRFDGRFWELVEGFAGRDVERAAALLRSRGWRVQPPIQSSAKDA